MKTTGLWVVAIATLVLACSSSDSDVPAGAAGAQAGNAGTAGSGGTAGVAGAAGISGAAGADAGDAGGSGPPPGGLEACELSWGKTCKAWEKCFPAFFAADFASVDECTKIQGESCAAAVYSPGANWTVADEEKCAAAVPDPMSCDVLSRFMMDNDATAIPECAPKGGSGQDSAACGSILQCKSLNCSIPTDAACGTCAASLAAGDDCSAGACSTGLLCAGATHLCVAPGDEGADCGYVKGKPCRAALACVSGKCVTPPNDGEACDPNAWNSCGTGHICNQTTKLCELITAKAKNAEPCGTLTTGSFDICEHGLVCKVTDPQTSAGACTPVIPEGGDCDAQAPFLMMGGGCAFPLSCVNGKCTAFHPAACQ